MITIIIYKTYVQLIALKLEPEWTYITSLGTWDKQIILFNFLCWLIINI